MANKIIILKDGYVPDKSVFNDKGKTYILTTEKETIPVSVLGVVKGEFDIVYAGSGSQAEYAFKLGELHFQDKNAKLYTEDTTLRSIFEGNTRSASEKTAKAPRKTRKTEPKEPETAGKETTKKSDAEEKTVAKTEPKKAATKAKADKKETAPKEKKPSAGGKTKTASDDKKATSKKDSMNPTKGKKVDFSKISRGEIEKLLDDNGFDKKYSDPIMDALSKANDVTADLFVRTQVSLVEKDKKVITDLGNLIKNTYC